jgi:adenylylsulfate kinase-like enzyme
MFASCGTQRGSIGERVWGQAPHLPGATEAYEEPEKADLVVSGVTPPEDGARALAALLRERGLLPLAK